MALYAYGEEGELVHAADGEYKARYHCLECGAPVQVRRGRYRFPHFYHLRTSKGCRLYSKSEDHLLLQLQLQRLLPAGEAVIEHPFFPICRVADLYWKNEGVVFEIQCSPISREEAEQRIGDYAKVGCDVIWLLDDRLFNRRLVRPAEEWLRAKGAYYVSLERALPQSFYYDQFEILLASKRLKKGRSLFVDLQSPCRIPVVEWPIELPSCVKRRWEEKGGLYARGDLVDRLLKVSLYPSYASAFSRWHALENDLFQAHVPPSRWSAFLRRYVSGPYVRALEDLLVRLP